MTDFELERLSPGDDQLILDLMDAAVAWLNRRGITEQWGSEPFSADPRRRAMVTGWRERSAPFLATYGGKPAGALVLGAHPDYVPAATEPEVYVNLLVSSHQPEARGVGRWLLGQAEAQTRAQGVELLRVDCYSGRGSRLPDFYESCGFVRTHPFSVGAWDGTVLEKRLHSSK
ncbi:MAG TPA: GNAT family N-acetyltransferase [Nocardioidaceae bacterium]|nr:GNAT family N-acetyltransferase [Nocardioidaceae bacterium]